MRSRLGLRISDQTKMALDEMCRGLHVNQSYLIEKLIKNYRQRTYIRDKKNHLARLTRALNEIKE
jgi:hypothetical protein